MRVVWIAIIVILDNCLCHFFSHGFSLPITPVFPTYHVLLGILTVFVLFLPQDCKLSEGRVLSFSFSDYLRA